MVRIGNACHADPARRDVYAAKYERYAKTLATLAPLWKEL
jgi:hypothetical protein